MEQEWKFVHDWDHERQVNLENLGYIHLRVAMGWLVLCEKESTTPLHWYDLQEVHI